MQEYLYYEHGDSSRGNLLVEYDGRAISSDVIGNMTFDGVWTYTWEHGRELMTMSDGSTTWTNTYNADGLRTRRACSTKTYTYVYNGSNLSQMTVAGFTLYFTYDASGTPMSVRYNDVTYYYATNVQGDVTAILDSSGTAVVEYTYDAWGNILNTTGSKKSNLGVHNPLRYRGYVYDVETGLYYLQSRYYDPEIGRFVNADSLVSTGQGILGNNMFAYCLNNPVNYVDKNGTDAEALQWWISTMWWLPAADTLLIIGDIIYYGGIAVFSIGALSTLTQTIPVVSLEEKNTDTSEKGEVTSGDPPTEEDGYRAPRGGPKKGKTKDGKTGWIDKNGNIWVPAPTGSSSAHGGGHWDVQRGDGKGYTNVYPGGKIRPGGGKPPIIPPIRNMLN